MQDLADVNNVLSSRLGELSSVDPTWPEDLTPAAFLPRGNESYIVAMLPARELLAWTLAGSPTEGHLTGRWVNDTTSGLEGREFWSSFEEPGTALPRLNQSSPHQRPWEAEGVPGENRGEQSGGKGRGTEQRGAEGSPCWIG